MLLHEKPDEALLVAPQGNRISLNNTQLQIGLQMVRKPRVRMDGFSLLLSKLELTAHHKLQISPGLDRSEVVRSSHDVLREDVNPLEVPLPFWLNLGGGRRWRQEERVQQLRVRDQQRAQDARKCWPTV